MTIEGNVAIASCANMLAVDEPTQRFDRHLPAIGIPDRLVPQMGLRQHTELS